MKPSNHVIRFKKKVNLRRLLELLVLRGYYFKYSYIQQRRLGRACAWMTKPSLAMRPTGRTVTRVLASASMPSVTLVTVYSASSTCTHTCMSRMKWMMTITSCQS